MLSFFPRDVLDEIWDLIESVSEVKKLLNVRLAGDHRFGKLLFTWLSLVVSIVMSFYAVLVSTRCLG